MMGHEPGTRRSRRAVVPPALLLLLLSLLLVGAARAADACSRMVGDHHSADDDCGVPDVGQPCEGTECVLNLDFDVYINGARCVVCVDLSSLSYTSRAHASV